MKIYKVVKETHCDSEWNTSGVCYPLYDELKLFSTREKANEYIRNFQCDTIATLFDGNFNAKEVECDWYGYERMFVADNEYYNYFYCLLGIEEIEVE